MLSSRLKFVIAFFAAPALVALGSVMDQGGDSSSWGQGHYSSSLSDPGSAPSLSGESSDYQMGVAPINLRSYGELPAMDGAIASGGAAPVPVSVGATRPSAVTVPYRSMTTPATHAAIADEANVIRQLGSFFAGYIPEFLAGGLFAGVVFHLHRRRTAQP